MMTAPSRPVVGFTAPAQDGTPPSLDLNAHCIGNATATFIMRACESFESAYVSAGDLLIIDRSVDPRAGALVVAVRQGEMVLERFGRATHSGKELEETLWGVVTYIVRACGNAPAGLKGA